MKTERLDEHDMTKKMMDVMRGGYKSLLTEVVSDQNMDPQQEFQQQQNPEQPKTNMVDTIDGPEPDGTLTPVQGDAVFNDELKKLQDTVDSSVDITNFKIYPSDKNIMIEGILEERNTQGSGIKFRMELKAGEIKTAEQNIAVTQTALTDFQSIAGARTTWTFEDKTEDARLRTVCSGLRAQYQNIVTEYNARAGEVDRAMFVDGLPLFFPL